MTIGRGHVDIREVVKRYPNGALVLDRINLSIQKSEFISIIGPSGCGKSTLLKLISGLSPHSSGSITVDGMSPANAREIMSFIFQDATLLPWRTVLRNVVLGMELHGANRQAMLQIARQSLNLVGLDHVANQYPRQLSGGMKMRVSIARALVTRPRILLMDEPFAALDEMTRDRLNEELIRLRAQDQWTGLFVTHSVSEAVFLSDRVIVLSAHPGRIAHEVKIEFPGARNAELRTQPIFDATVSEVSKALRSVIHQTAINEEKGS
jgi:NitT/TauT family transport system ATP-binding protein